MDQQFEPGIGSFSRLREKAGDEGVVAAKTLTPTLSREREREQGGLA
jgi:hypothetical protein